MLTTTRLPTNTCTGLWEAHMTAFLCGQLTSFVERNKLGSVFSSQAKYECFSSGSAAESKPTISFIAAHRLTTATLFADAFEIEPDLVVDIVGREESYYAVDARIEAYQRANVRLIWIVLPQPPVIQVFHSGRGEYRRQGDWLSGDDVLPGFSLPVASIFALPAEPESSHTT